MTIRELKAVCPTGIHMFMHDKNTGENIEIPVCDKKNNPSFLRGYKIGEFPYQDVLRVQEIYSDNGLVAEIKFNKDFWRMYKMMLKFEAERRKINERH